MRTHSRQVTILSHAFTKGCSPLQPGCFTLENWLCQSLADLIIQYWTCYGVGLSRNETRQRVIILDFHTGFLYGLPSMEIPSQLFLSPEWIRTEYCIHDGINYKSTLSWVWLSWDAILSTCHSYFLACLLPDPLSFYSLLHLPSRFHVPLFNLKSPLDANEVF